MSTSDRVHKVSLDNRTIRHTICGHIGAERRKRVGTLFTPVPVVYHMSAVNQPRTEGFI